MPVPEQHNMPHLKSAYNNVSRAVEELADLARLPQYSEHHDESDRIFKLLLEAQTSLAKLMAGKL